MPSLLDGVARGETVVITGNGKLIARRVPEAEVRRTSVERAFAEFREFRKSMPKIPLDEFLSARHEGHRF
jgi:antitoxin (DNA-binding transcriptional repressor) of toxin-antitoxin stability system